MQSQLRKEHAYFAKTTQIENETHFLFQCIAYKGLPEYKLFTTIFPLTIYKHLTSEEKWRILWIKVKENRNQFHSNDVLWDGRDCHSSSTCCSRRNPPYFTKHLNTSTTDDIELRMCHHYDLRFSNIAVELVEVYVR